MPRMRIGAGLMAALIDPRPARELDSRQTWTAASSTRIRRPPNASSQFGRCRCQPSPPAARRAIIIGGSMSGLFSAAFLRQIGWDCDVYERSPVRTASAAAPASPRIRNCWRRWRRAAPARAISASRWPERIAHRPAGPHHRRAAAAANPDLVGSPAAAAARDHRPRALSSRLGVRARRAERQRRARSFQRRPRRGTPISWSAATASARPCAARSRRNCSRSMPAITSGAARRTRPISRRGR